MPVDVIAIEGDVVIRRDGREARVHSRYDYNLSAEAIARAVALALEEFGIPARSSSRHV